MRKYEKPQLVEVSGVLESTIGACEDGCTNIEDCVGGGVVVPGCNNGVTPLTVCGGGGGIV